MPLLAMDVFAFAAHLIERGGLYHRVIIEKTGRTVGPPWTNGNNLIIREEEIKIWSVLGRAWGGLSDESAYTPAPDPESMSAAYQKISETHWQPLMNCASEFKWKKFQTWGKHAFALLVISDEASRDLGYQLDKEKASRPLEEIMEEAWFAARRTTRVDDDFEWHERATTALTNFAAVASPYIVRVMPKSRTPAVGNTMRTLSHNLALVPPISGVDLNWHRDLRAWQENRDPLNLLLVPFPYRISALCFEPHVGHARNDDQKDHWSCMFDLNQRWLIQSGERTNEASSEDRTASQNLIVQFILALIARSKRDVEKIHGLLLPELALDWPTYNLLVRTLITEANGNESLSTQKILDFIVCGSSTDWGEDKGNFVLVTTFYKNDAGKLAATTHSQSKHHRWRLTGSQISDYGLSAALDPHAVWWEGIEIRRREVGLTMFRSGSVFSAMICEDLARSEPCHEPLKSVGPNLVFALLLDGPQLPYRWSARYATSLADDPGSSVLTLTSLGLIERINSAGTYKECRNIALWKDDTGRTVEISCPKDSEAILLTLGGDAATEQTVDGRPSSDATSWRYQGHQPVRLSIADQQKYDWIFWGR